MAYVNPSTQTIKTCFQNHYSLPYFQREYKWESRHFIELLNDIQNSFLLSYDISHGRNEVAGYAPYFLGSIITSSSAEGKKPLIDGQQRLTSAFLIIAYLERFRRDNSIENAPDLSNLLGSVNFGSMDYSIEFSDSRRSIFDAYLDKTKSLSDAMMAAEDIQNLDDGDRKILEALRATESLIDSAVRGAIAYFIDYVVERVLLIDISVDSEAEAHRVFVTMNDRGLRLGPIDLLKGQILSKITSPVDSRNCPSEWTKTINSLKSIDPEEDSLFFRNLFRAKWAKTIRGKSKGDAAGDFDMIGDAYHRWFEKNTSELKLQNADDYTRFAGDEIPKYARIYKFIKEAEEDLVDGFEHIYYNSVRRYGFQSMLLLSSVEVDDNTSEWKEKISLVSKLIDLILTSRIIEGKENNYDNLKEISFQIARELRGRSKSDLLKFVKSEWTKYYAPIRSISAIRYSKSERSDILYLLVRIASYLEDVFSVINKVGFATYWQRDRGGRTFDIEHRLEAQFDPAALPATHGFVDAKDYADNRNLIGALTLLPRSRNRSLQDKPYREKLGAYATENILTQTLCDNLYQNNPNVATYVSGNPSLRLASISDFERPDIEKRGKFYSEIAEIVWKEPA